MPCAERISGRNPQNKSPVCCLISLLIFFDAQLLAFYLQKARFVVGSGSEVNMMNRLLVLAAIFTCGFAQASVYRLDYEQLVPEDIEMVRETCVQEIQIDLTRAVEPQILKQMVSKMISSEKIEGSKSIDHSGVGPYTGEVRTSVYLVKRDGYGAYKPNIVERVEINLYSSALNIQTQLLNHRNSAELAEDACRNLSYRKVAETPKK